MTQVIADCLTAGNANAAASPYSLVLVPASARSPAPASPMKWLRASPPRSPSPSRPRNIAARIQQEFSSETLRLYTSTRRHRRRAGRRAQKRHRHRRRNRRRRRPRPQLHRRAHHPRHRGDHAPRRSLRRPPRNPRRPLRRRRPGAHLHRLAQPQPHRGRGARPGPQAATRFSSRSAAKWLKACAPPAPRWASPASTASRCPSPSRWS